MPPVNLFEILLPFGLFAGFSFYIGVMFNMPQRNNRPIDSSGSSVRKTASWVALFVIALSVLALFTFDSAATQPRSVPMFVIALAYGAPAFSFAYFCFVILYVLFLTMDDTTFQADAVRLARDTAISIGLSIATAALLYKQLGIVATFGTDPIRDFDYIYFSAVTFSTLGYGDFRPDVAARWLAALQAIIGNIHLGIVVGTVLVALKGGRPS